MCHRHIVTVLAFMDIRMPNIFIGDVFRSRGIKRDNGKISTIATFCLYILW